MKTADFTLTHFLQHSGDVLDRLNAGEVHLRRRDGDDLVLMTRRQREAMGTAARVFAAVARNDAATLRNILYWLPYLSEPDTQTFLRDLDVTLVAAERSGRLDQLADLLYSWEMTGLAAWDDQQDARRQIDATPESDVAHASRSAWVTGS